MFLPLRLFARMQNPEALYRNLATKLIMGMPYKVKCNKCLPINYDYVFYSHSSGVEL